MTLYERIIELVNSTQGIKGTELAAQLAAEFIGFSSTEILLTIEGLAQRREIVEVQYCLPTMSYRTKSFYLPKGTEVNP